MKIVYCLPALYNPGGMERVLTEKVNYLITQGFDVTIITTDQKGRENYFKLLPPVKLVDFELNFEDHFNVNLLKKTQSHYKKTSLYKKKLYNYLIRNEVDICISLCGKEIDFLTSLTDQSIKMAEIHFSMNNRKLFIMARHQGLMWRLIGDFRTWQLKRATRQLEKLVVLTEQDAKDWLKTHDNILSIPNPTPFVCDMFADINSKTAISVGKLDEQKGYDYLLKSWKIVCEKHPDWKLKIFGKGAWHDQLTSYINQNELNGVVELCGTTTDIKKEYLNSALYVMSSRYEGLPMVLIEAMACGLPLISFDCECGPRAVINNGENGYLVPVGNIEGLADKICSLIENEDLRQQMSQKSKEYSVRYSPEIIMNQWVDLFESLEKRKIK